MGMNAIGRGNAQLDDSDHR